MIAKRHNQLDIYNDGDAYAAHLADFSYPGYGVTSAYFSCSDTPFGCLEGDMDGAILSYSFNRMLTGFTGSTGPKKGLDCTGSL